MTHPNESVHLTAAHLIEILKDLDPNARVDLAVFTKFAMTADGKSHADACRVVGIAKEASGAETSVMLSNASWSRMEHEERFSLQLPAAPWVVYFDYDSSNPPPLKAAWEQMNQVLGDPIFLPGK